MNSILFVGEHPKIYDVRWHSHKHWEFVYCTSGKGAFHLKSGAIIPYHAEEVVVLPPNEIHANFSDEGFTNIHLTMEDPSFPYKTAFRMGDDNGSIGQVFRQAKLYYMSDKKKHELILAALGDLITSYIVVLRSNTEFSQPVAKIRTSIMQNFTCTDYALEEFIRKLPFHYDYLRKLFKKEVGMSPLEYLTDLRMKNAEQLLTMMWSSGYTISEIAQMCGFQDALYFSRVFKKHYGCAPSKFIQKNREIYAIDPNRIELEAEKSTSL